MQSWLTVSKGFQVCDLKQANMKSVLHFLDFNTPPYFRALYDKRMYIKIQKMEDSIH